MTRPSPMRVIELSAKQLALSKQAAIASTALMAVQILAYLIIAGRFVLDDGAPSPPAILAAIPAMAFLLLAFFVWEQRAKAVDITAYLATAQCTLLVCVIGLALSGGRLLIAAGLLLWLISGIALVARLYTFQRILNPPAPRPASAFPVIMPAPPAPMQKPPEPPPEYDQGAGI